MDLKLWIRRLTHFLDPKEYKWLLNKYVWIFDVMVMITCDAAKQRKDFWEKSQERSNNQKWKRLKSQKQNESSWEINEPASFNIYYEGKKDKQKQFVVECLFTDRWEAKANKEISDGKGGVHHSLSLPNWALGEFWTWGRLLPGHTLKQELWMKQ